MPTRLRFTGLKLDESDRVRLKQMETGGARMSVRTWRRVRTLLLLDLGYTVTATAEALGTLGRETARVALADHGLKPWREKNVVRAGNQQRVHRPHGGRAPPLRS